MEPMEDRRAASRFVAAIGVVVALSTCSSEPDRPPIDDSRPPELLKIAEVVEEMGFSDVVQPVGLQPLATTHRFFEGPRGHSLGVGVAFDDPAREPELNLHFDRTEEGAKEQFGELRTALEGGLLPDNDPGRFCSATGPWVECAAVEQNYVVAARAKDEVRFVQRLVDLGLSYAHEVSR